MTNNAITYRFNGSARKIAAAIGCDVLIGMDIISIVDLAITCGSHGTTFSFKTPHGTEIDFSAHSSQS